MTFIEACRAWKKVSGETPRNISIILEGEEESGSPSLVPFLEENAKELAADIAFICDTGLLGEDQPAIVTMLRGLLGEEIIVTGPDLDLHSGAFGGMAANPARVLARIIAGLHDENGRVTVPGFYEGVHEIEPEIKAQWEALDFSHSKFLGDVGLSVPAGERDRTPLEMIWSRPTCEVNGLTGGYSGEGFKTVLPSKASAKISFRLVGSQNPLEIFRGVSPLTFFHARQASMKVMSCPLSSQAPRPLMTFPLGVDSSDGSNGSLRQRLIGSTGCTS